MKKTTLRFSTDGFPQEQSEALAVSLEEIPGFAISVSERDVSASKVSDSGADLKFSDFMEIGKAIKSFCLSEKLISGPSDNSRFLPLEHSVSDSKSVPRAASGKHGDSGLVTVPKDDLKVNGALSAAMALRARKNAEAR